VSARQKLNGAFLTGGLVVAGLAGLATGSGTVFLVALSALVAIDIVAGNIRPGGRK
jgi:hypothetical protein